MTTINLRELYPWYTEDTATARAMRTDIGW